MGNLCSQDEIRHREIVDSIIKESDNTITEEDIEELIMSTQCIFNNFVVKIKVNDEELYNLFKYFKDLDIDKQKSLTNNQFLQFPFLRFSPLKPLLFHGFLLKEDKEFPEFATKEEDKKDKKPEEKKADKPATASKKTPEENAKNVAKIVEDQKLRDQQNIPICKKHYIGFKEFARHLSVFNRKTPLDLKIKCIFLF